MSANDPTILKICPNCTKPNAKSLQNCSTCSTSLASASLKTIHSCLFCDIITGHKTGEVILYKDNLISIFLAEFALCYHQIIVCPIVHIPSVLWLDNSKECLHLLWHMYRVGTQIMRALLLQRRYFPPTEKLGNLLIQSEKFGNLLNQSEKVGNLLDQSEKVGNLLNQSEKLGNLLDQSELENICSGCKYPSIPKIFPELPKIETTKLSKTVFDEDIQDPKKIYSGFNFPPQIPHLHLVLFTLPLIRDNFSESTLAYPRWLPFLDVVRSLIGEGRVLTGNERTDEGPFRDYREALVVEHYNRKKLLVRSSL